MFYIIGFLFLFSAAYAWLSLAPWVPTPNKELKRIDKIVRLKPGQIFVEMGCGNGRVCTYIAKKNPTAKVVGIELALPFYLFTKLSVTLFGPRNLSIVFGNALKYDISNVDVLYVYGLTNSLNNQIKKKISKEMPSKAKLISYVFSMKKWSGKATTVKGSKGHADIFVYQK
jgi:precorrin-6B methylase 2